MFTNVKLPILYTNDIAKAKAFYINVLGFRIDSDSGNFVVLALGETNIALNTADKPLKVPGHQTIMVISNAIQHDYEEVQKRGIVIELALTDLGYGKTFIIRDVDGNKIEVVE